MVERRRRGSDRSRYDSDDGHDSRRERRRSGHIMKVLCPYYNAGAIIGKGGDRIKDVKDRSGASIEISRHDARFPGTEERVISLQGDKEELQSAVRYINERMREDDAPSSSGRRSDDENDRRRRTCRVIVCDSSMAMIIGRNGDNIRDLKKDHCVQINTSKRNETPRELDERIVSIEGEDRDVDRCLEDIIDQIATDDRSRMRFYVDYAEFNKRYGRQYRRRDDRYDRRGGRRSRDRDDRYRSRSRDRSRSYERRRRDTYDEDRGGRRTYSKSRSRSR